MDIPAHTEVKAWTNQAVGANQNGSSHGLIYVDPKFGGEVKGHHRPYEQSCTTHIMHDSI